MKKLLLTLLSGILLVPLILSGCAKSDSTPTSGEAIKLVYSDFRTEQAFTFKGMVVPWQEEITAKTNGRVVFENYPNGTLGAAGDSYDMVVNSICDIAAPMTEYTPGKFPLFEINKLPMLFPSAKVASMVLSELTEKYCIDTEFKDVKVLWISATTPLQLQLRKQVTTMADLKGLRINCEGRVVSQTLEALGAVPVSMDVPEIYSSLERGVIDGTVFGWEGTIAFKIQDVTQYRTACDLCVMAWPIIMNLDKWNSLPADVKQVFEEAGGAKRAETAAAAFDYVDTQIRDTIAGIDAKVGNPAITYLTNTEKAKWLETVKPVWYAWAEEKDAAGLPGTEMLEDAIALVEKYQ